MPAVVQIIRRDVEKTSAAAQAEQKSILLAEVKSVLLAEVRAEAAAELKEELRAELKEELKAEAEVEKAAGACTPARATQHMPAAAADAGLVVPGERIKRDSDVETKGILEFFPKYKKYKK